MSKVALVIGGSGMLSEFCRGLTDDYDAVGIVGRSEQKMNSLVGLDAVHPIFVDYTDAAEFEAVINKFVQGCGRPSLVVSWMHSIAGDAVVSVAKVCSGELYEITGIAGANSDHISRKHEELTRDMDADYHRIVLAKNGDEWLSNAEISAGVLTAVKTGLPEYVVGSIA